MPNLLQPFINIMAKAVEAHLDKKAEAELVLYILPSDVACKNIASKIDEMVKGGLLVEAVDGEIAEDYLKELRSWAQTTLADLGHA